jgi:nucleotide-binding universal stress UspA family protein
VNKCTEFRCDTKITFSCTNDLLEKYDPHLLFELDKHTQTPLTLLNVKKPAELSGKIELPFTWQCDKEIAQNIRLESRKSLSVSEGIAKHIACQNAELLCIGRSQRKSFLRSLFFSRYSTMAEIINAVNIPVLLAPLNNGSGMMSLDKQA